MDLKKTHLKYRLREILDSLTIKQYEQAMREIPILIGKCKNTLNGYAAILATSKAEMPYRVGWIIEDYFGLPPRGLYNLKMNCKCLFEGSNVPAVITGQNKG